jgi:SAM-dependent methyltransferase
MARSEDLNRANWDERAPAHAASPDYGFQHLIADPHHLSETVRFDLPLLGDLSGVRGVHLQCHIGTDTVSLARLGASMTGLDFSSASIREARRLSAQSGTPVEFVESNVHDALDVLPAADFDLVYTGIGALCWLPEVRQWADVVAGLARPGGRLFIREAHPMLWALDESRSDELVVGFPYFEHSEPFVEDAPGTYVTSDVEFTHNVTHTWNHGLGEIITALFDAGMQVTGLVEHQTVPWEALPGQMEMIGLGEWRIRDRPWRLAHSYTLQATKLS